MSGEQIDNQARQSTPAAELERRIMDPNIPKNEQEHWAAGEIHRLHDLLRGGCPMHPIMHATHTYVECSDCDANGEYHRNGTAHCETCGWPESDCDGDGTRRGKSPDHICQAARTIERSNVYTQAVVLGERKRCMPNSGIHITSAGKTVEYNGAGCLCGMFQGKSVGILRRCTRYPACGALLMVNERCYSCNALPPGEWKVAP